jgi:ribonuclease-3
LPAFVYTSPELSLSGEKILAGFFDKLEDAIAYQFKNPQLLQQALTHKSFSNEQAAATLHNERLEFLGDAVLELAVSEWVFNRYPDLPEGGLTRIRAEVVSEKGLAKVARTLCLGDGLLLGKGEGRSGGGEKASLLSDALEALLGAVYCDGGFAAACTVVTRLFSADIEHSAQSRYGTDCKTCLQERLQAVHGRLPEYLLTQTSGPDHERVFSIEVRLDGKLLGRGQGPSKKRAEQQAAAAALDHPLAREVN